MLFIPLLLLVLVQNGKSTLFQTTATVTEHSGKTPPIIYVYKKMPPSLMPISAPLTSYNPAHERKEIYQPRPLLYQGKTLIPIIRQQPQPVYVNHQPTSLSLSSPASSFQLDQQKRNYLQQLDYLNRHQTPIINEHFQPSPIDYGFQPIIKPSIPIITNAHHTYNLGDFQTVVTPQPFGYVRSYVDLLKQRQKQLFANEEPNVITGTPYDSLKGYGSHGSYENDGEEYEHDGENISVNNESASDDGDNSVQQENVEHSGEVGYFKQREHEIGKEKYNGHKKTKHTNSNENIETHNPKLYRVTEDYEDPGEDDVVSNDNNNEGSDEDDENSYNHHYSTYLNRNKDTSYEHEEYEPDEDEEESKKHEKAVPIKVYAQVRHVKKKTRQPKPMYEPNLKERLSQEKRHLVYKEEGYEDKEYDHAGEQKHTANHEQKENKNRKRKRQKRKKSKQLRTKRETESLSPEALQSVGKPFRGSKKFGSQSNNLTGIELINHINELIENTTVYLPDDESRQQRLGKSVKDQETSASDSSDKTFVSVFRPNIDQNRYFKDYKPVKSIYATKTSTECNEEDIDLDEKGFDGTKKKRGGNLGKKLDCLKNKHFGVDPFHSPFFKGELGKTGALVNRKHSANVSKVVYDDVMNIIKNSQIVPIPTPTTEKPHKRLNQIRKPQSSYLEDSSSEENVFSPSHIRPTSVTIPAPVTIYKGKQKPTFAVFDINQYYPKTIDLTTSKTKIYKIVTTTPSYSLTTPAPIPYRSPYQFQQPPSTPVLQQNQQIIRHPNLIIHKQPQSYDQVPLQSTQIQSHLHTNVFRPVFRPSPGKRYVVHRYQH